MSKNIGKIIAGVGLGVGLGMLFAPEKGKDTRKKLANKLNEMCESIKSIDKDDVDNDDPLYNDIVEFVI